MPKEKTAGIIVEHYVIKSTHLNRDVIVDFYLPLNEAASADISLLLFNDKGVRNGITGCLVQYIGLSATNAYH